MGSRTEKISFTGSLGETLAARLDLPEDKPQAYAIFAHCFTCSKETHAATRVADALTQHGIAVLRFDFTGLGGSGGDFANTNFSSNVADLRLAADHLRKNYEAPRILIGHSLGGTAVLAVAKDIPEVRAVSTINSPSDAAHVAVSFGAQVDEIERDGAAQVTLAGRHFTIRRDFLDDLRAQSIADCIRDMKKALLVFHAPGDMTVGIENAAEVFGAARHPKSFVSLEGADHLLTRKADATYVASMLAVWASRYLPEQPVSIRHESREQEEGTVLVAESGVGKFAQSIWVGPHNLRADEPASVGGNDSGPSPYDFLAVALGACTSMTLRMYAERKGLTLGQISVKVQHAKVHAQDCAECEGREGRVDRFERTIKIAGGVPAEIAGKIVEIAGKCPVHRTLEAKSVVATTIAHD
ncbi:MAG: alpha/beta fold hydrolase [Aestuariivirga sp.]